MSWLKNFFDKILGRNEVKMLPSPIDMENTNIDMETIKRYLEDSKYSKNLGYEIKPLNPSAKKKLLSRMEYEMGGNPNWKHDNFSILEGKISIYNFISFKKYNVPPNRIGQLIYYENGYIDITEQKNLENNIENLQYKSFTISRQVREETEYNEQNGSYSYEIGIGNISYKESAGVAKDEELAYIENYMQPSYPGFNSNQYVKDTGLPIVTKERKSNIKSTIIEDNPYIVILEFKEIKNKTTIKKTITKIFRSKKQCIVGYKPIIIFMEEFNDEKQEYRMYRLLKDKLYIDNQTYNSTSDSQTSFTKLSLEEISNKTGGMPFSLSKDAKRYLNEGLELPTHIKEIYEIGKKKIINYNKI